MRLRLDHYHPQVLSALACIEEVELAERTKNVPLSSLAAGMLVEQDICVRSGMCLIGRGQQITATSLQRLQGFEHSIDTDLMVRVRIPEAEPRNPLSAFSGREFVPPSAQA